jgi:polysaccharide pyruvyl transferase WcaK-like protein
MTPRREIAKERELRGDRDMLRARLDAIAQIIEDVDQRCIACDGPVTPTKDEITSREIVRIYRLARRRRVHTVRAIRRPALKTPKRGERRG